MRRSWYQTKGFIRPQPVARLIAILITVMLTGTGCTNGSSTSPAPTVSPTPTQTATPTPMPTPSPVAFVPNTFAFWDDPANWTTPYGPAYADISLQSSNFVPCLGGPYALCYYSGPPPQTCTLSADKRFGDCQCFALPFGQYFVDINGILNHDVYIETVAVCGSDGSKCQKLNSAPVCQAVNQGQLIPGADLVSTFSFDCVPTNGIGQTNCGASLYAGCMTAGCHGIDQSGFTTCQCPAFNGPYQVGLNDQQCTLGGDEIWSAAYTPPNSMPSATPTLSGEASISRSSGNTIPHPSGCVPDATGSIACPLYAPGKTVLPPGSGVDCTKVCAKYDTCLNSGAQTGYTCDSTLCTRDCNDRDLVGQACNGLNQCDISEIIKAESAAQCSCCASQLCNCSPDQATNVVIAKLNQAQTARGITPQCAINGTLCGTSLSSSARARAD